MSYDTILVAVDGSDPADSAARGAVLLADAFDASVAGVTAVEEHSLSLTGESEEPTPDEAAQQALESLESRAADAGVPCRTAVQRGAAHEVITGWTDRLDADLVAMGTHGRTGIDRVLLGSVADRVLRTSDVPVLTTHALEDGPETIEEVLVPTDGSDCAERALDHAVAVGERFDARLHGLSAVDVQAISAAYEGGGAIPTIVEDLEEAHERAVDTVIERADDHDLEVTTALPQGSPSRLIREYVEEHDVDLVAMGTHGRSGLDRYLLGSVAERVVRTSGALVLAVPPESTPGSD